MLGYTAEELNQVRWTDITPAEDLAEEMKIFESVLAGKDLETLKNAISERMVPSLMFSSPPGLSENRMGVSTIYAPLSLT
jgi:hypothetical protein